MDANRWSSTGLDALLTGAAFAALNNRGWLRITGEDRVRWLNGMVTNSIQALRPGTGCLNFLLNAQGRIQGEGYAFLTADAVLFETALDRREAVQALLDRFIIMDDVELAPDDAQVGLLLAGPEAPGLLGGLLPGFEAAELTRSKLHFAGEPMAVVALPGPLVPRFGLWCAPASLPTLQAALEAAGARRATAEALEALRVLEGTPLFGTDIGERDLPQETALNGHASPALHFSKGCYLGQEIVERIRSRGNVHRTLAGFALSGALPPPGTALEANGKPVGTLSSTASIPLPGGEVLLGLGIVRREALAETLTYPGGSAQPVALPYAPALSPA